MRRTFVPQCSDLEQRLALSVAVATLHASPPAHFSPTHGGVNPSIKPYPTSGGTGGVNPSIQSGPTDGTVMASIKPYPTSGGTGGVNPSI